MNFDFISDEKFRLLLIRDYEELNKCIEVEASKSVLILCGSLVESILTDYFLNLPPKNMNLEKDILKMDLAGLINLAFDYKIISNTSKDLSNVLRNYRNLIHPGREIRNNEKFDVDTAKVAKSLLNIILKEIKENYISNIGHTAIDIISKLENDSISQPIFEKIISKTHKSEKTKLYIMLIEYNLNENKYPTELTDPKKYLRILESQIEKEVVVQQLLKLVKIIELGEQWQAMRYFYLLNDVLIYLDKNNLELVLLYVLNVMIDYTDQQNMIEVFYEEKLFVIFGKHLISDEIQNEFKTLLCKLVTNYEKDQIVYFNAYNQLINSVDNDKKDIIKQFIIAKTGTYNSTNFYREYNDGDYIPF